MVLKKGDLWSNSFIMLMKDHYRVKCIMNRTDVWNERQEQWSIVISDIYYIVTKQWVLY